MTTYLIDSNILITPHRSYYPFDFAPSFWNFLIEEVQKGALISIDKVKEEIVRGEDQLANWFSHNISEHCIKTDSIGILQAYQVLVNHISNSKLYNQKAKNEFMQADNADTWLLAYCLNAQKTEKDVCLVTLEELNPTVKKRVPIPNVCEDFNIDYCNLFTLIRRLNFSF